MDDTAASTADILAAIEDTGVALSAEQREALRESLTPLIKWRLIRFLLLDGQNHNYGTVVLPSIKTASGAPLRLYRTGLTARPDTTGSCVHGLLTRGGVRHVLNLYSGAIPTDDLVAAERRAAKAQGATYFHVTDDDFIAWRDHIREHPGDPVIVRAAMESVARLINQQILRPGGETPRGNVHLHCGGGMHRTGMIIGILQRCINKTPMEQIEADYKHHVDWQSESDPGGYEADNIEFIRAFDCTLVQP